MQNSLEMMPGYPVDCGRPTVLQYLNLTMSVFRSLYPKDDIDSRTFGTNY